MFLKLFQRRKLKRRHMTRREMHSRRDASIISFFPSGSTKTPAISGHQSGKLIHRIGGRQIITEALAELEKHCGDFNTHDVQPGILSAGITAAISIKSCHWISAANH